MLVEELEGSNIAVQLSREWKCSWVTEQSHTHGLSSVTPISSLVTVLLFCFDLREGRVTLPRLKIGPLVVLEQAAGGCLS